MENKKRCRGCKEMLDRDMFSGEKMVYCRGCRLSLKKCNWYSAAYHKNYRCERCKRIFDFDLNFHFKFSGEGENRTNISRLLRNKCSEEKIGESIESYIFLCNKCFTKK